MPALPVDKGINELKKLLKKNRLIIMAGAGISIDPPSNLRSWAGLLDEIIHFCLDQKKRLSADELKRFEKLLIIAASQVKEDPIKVASIVRKAVDDIKKVAGKNTYEQINNALKNNLSDTINTALPNHNHTAIASTNYPYILTTNYDRLIERAAKKDFQNLAESSFTYEDAAVVAKNIYNNEASIIHLHGDTNGINLDSIIFTAKDYQKIRRNYPGFNLTIQTLFMRYSVLFVGYGGNDPHMDEIEQDLAAAFDWPQYPDSHLRHFIALPKTEANDIMVAFKELSNVETIVLPDSQYTTKLLKELQISCPRPPEKSKGVV